MKDFLDGINKPTVDDSLYRTSEYYLQDGDITTYESRDDSAKRNLVDNLRKQLRDLKRLQDYKVRTTVCPHRVFGKVAAEEGISLDMVETWEAFDKGIYFVKAKNFS